MIDQARLSPVVSSLQTNLNTENQSKQSQLRDDSPIAQVRSYVEKQMDQLQQDLEFGFSRTPKPALPSTSSPNLVPNTITPVG